MQNTDSSFNLQKDVLCSKWYGGAVCLCGQCAYAVVALTA